MMLKAPVNTESQKENILLIRLGHFLTNVTNPYPQDRNHLGCWFLGAHLHVQRKTHILTEAVFRVPDLGVPQAEALIQYDRDHGLA